MALVRAQQYFRLKCITPLLDAEVKLVVHGSDALAMVHRAPLSCGTNMPLHVLVPDDQVGHAASILTEHWGYTKHNNPPFPESSQSIYSFRPSTLLADGDSATVMLFHHDRAKYKGATCIFLHPSSTFRFDLDDPSRTITASNPLHPSLAAILFPTEIAFLDSVADVLLDPPAPPVSANPFRRWLFLMFEYTFCEYPNEREAAFMDCYDDDREWEWKEETRIWGSESIPALKYVERAVKEENRHFLCVDFHRKATEACTPWKEMVRMHYDIKARRMNDSKLVSAEAASHNPISFVLDVHYSVNASEKEMRSVKHKLQGKVL